MQFGPGSAEREKPLEPHHAPHGLDQRKQPQANRKPLRGREAVARIHGSWTRGLPTLPEGADTLERLLVERIEATGGKCLLHERAESIVVRRGQAAGVVLDGEREPVGTSFVLSDLDGEGIASLTSGKGLHSRALREWPRITYPVGRFVVNVVAAREGVPAPLGPEVLLPMVARGEGRR